MKLPIKISACFLLGAVAVVLAGCGSHEQNTPSTTSASGGTPPEIVQKAKQQSTDMANHPPPGAYVPPGHTPGH